MRLFCIVISIFIIWQQGAFALDTDRAIFLFDTGETNFIASMLEYALSHEPHALKASDFCIIFMGASADAMRKEPFCTLTQPCIHYMDLGIQEPIDRYWQRDRMLSASSIAAIRNYVHVRKEIWAGASTIIFKQLFDAYCDVPSVAVRDFPFINDPAIDHSGRAHRVRQEVCAAASCALVPSTLAKEEVQKVTHTVICVGHPPTEQYCAQMNQIDRQAMIKKLNLDPNKPIIVFTGSYGSSYRSILDIFFSYCKANQEIFRRMQLIILPHPQFQGSIEKQEAYQLDDARIAYQIRLGDDCCKPIDIIAIADCIITPNATSNLVLQMAAVSKKILYLQQEKTPVASLLSQMKIITPVISADDFGMQLDRLKSGIEKGMPQYPDVSQAFGIPKNSAQRLWQLFCNNQE